MHFAQRYAANKGNARAQDHLIKAAAGVEDLHRSLQVTLPTPAILTAAAKQDLLDELTKAVVDYAGNVGADTEEALVKGACKVVRIFRPSTAVTEQRPFGPPPSPPPQQQRQLVPPPRRRRSQSSSDDAAHDSDDAVYGAASITAVLASRHARRDSRWTSLTSAERWGTEVNNRAWALQRARRTHKRAKRAANNNADRAATATERLTISDAPVLAGVRTTPREGNNVSAPSAEASVMDAE